MQMLLTILVALMAGVVGFYLGRRRTPLRLSVPKVALLQPLSHGDLHEVDDGKTIRYLGNDEGAAETIWTQLERHGISGSHSWRVNGIDHKNRTI